MLAAVAQAPFYGFYGVVINVEAKVPVQYPHHIKNVILPGRDPYAVRADVRLPPVMRHGPVDRPHCAQGIIAIRLPRAAGHAFQGVLQGQAYIPFPKKAAGIGLKAGMPERQEQTEKVQCKKHQAHDKATSR